MDQQSTTTIQDPFAVLPTELETVKNNPAASTSLESQPSNSPLTPQLGGINSNNNNNNSPPIIPQLKVLTNPPFVYHGHNKNDNTNPIPTNDKLQELLRDTLASPGRRTSLDRLMKYTEPLPPVVINEDQPPIPHPSHYHPYSKPKVPSPKSIHHLLPSPSRPSVPEEDVDPLQFFCKTSSTSTTSHTATTNLLQLLQSYQWHSPFPSKSQCTSFYSLSVIPSKLLTIYSPSVTTSCARQPTAILSTVSTFYIFCRPIGTNVEWNSE